MDDHSLNIDQDTIAYILRNIAPLEATETIENVADMEQYGLATDMRMFSFSTAMEYITYVNQEQVIDLLSLPFRAKNCRLVRMCRNAML